MNQSTKLKFVYWVLVRNDYLGEIHRLYGLKSRFERSLKMAKMGCAGRPTPDVGSGAGWVMPWVGQALPGAQ